jgi:hypothetical protein
MPVDMPVIDHRKLLILKAQVDVSEFFEPIIVPDQMPV